MYAREKNIFCQREKCILPGNDKIYTREKNMSHQRMTNIYQIEKYILPKQDNYIPERKYVQPKDDRYMPERHKYP